MPFFVIRDRSQTLCGTTTYKKKALKTLIHRINQFFTEFFTNKFSNLGKNQPVRHPRPGVEIEPVVGQVETLPGVSGETPGQRRQLEVIGGLLLLEWCTA